VNKETLRKLGETDTTKPLKTLIDQAIVEYIANRTFRVNSKTPDILPLRVDIIPKQRYVLRP
jgi:hypothetical protein